MPLRIKGVGKAFKKIEKRAIRPVVKATVQPVVKEVDRGLHKVERTFRRDILPVVVGAGRKRAKTSHVQADFHREHIQLVVTIGGEVNIQEVSSPCPGGDHNIVPCEQPLEIELNGGGFVFNDQFCTKCGEHFPFVA